MAITYKLEINNKPKIDKTHLILLRITNGRKHKRISTGVYVPKKDFNPSAQPKKWIRMSNPSHLSYNNKLNKFIKEAEGVEDNLKAKDINLNPTNIISSLNKKTDSSSFIDYFDEKLIQIDATKSVSYYKHLKSKLKNLVSFNNDLQFKDVTVKFLNEYKAHLSTKGLKENSVISNLRAIRTVLYLAMSEEVYLGNNPFHTFRLKEIKANKQKLSIEEIRTIESLKLEEFSVLWHIRNYFLFAFYGGGIRIGDLIQLKWKNIKEDRISFVMDKNDENHSTILLPKAKEILDYYKNDKVKSNDFVFPILESNSDRLNKKALSNLLSSKNALINKHLKSIQDHAHLDLNLTFHLSRHSFADFMRTQGASIYDIKNLLGHSDIKVTQKYLKGFDTNSSDKAISDAFKGI